MICYRQVRDGVIEHARICPDWYRNGGMERQMAKETIAERRERLDLERARNSELLRGVDGVASATAATLLESTADAWRAEAVELESSTRRGATGRRRLLREAADLATELAGSLRDVGADSDVMTDMAEECNATPTYGPFEAGGRVLRCTLTLGHDSNHSDEVADIGWPDAAVPQQPEESAPVEQPTFIEPPAQPTFAALMSSPDPATAPDHRSVSQISGFADCGLRYRLERRDGHQPRPAWWNVGGKALHACVERHLRGDLPAPGGWNDVFHYEISKTVQASGIPMDTWRAAARGAEGYTWWLVEGERMLDQYLVAQAGWLEEGWRPLVIDGVPVVEWAFTLNITAPDDPSRSVPLVGVIDQAWARGNEVRVRDIKAGKSAPDDAFQLKAYARALRAAAPSGAREVQWTGDFYRARQGETTLSVDLGTEVDDEVTYRVMTMDAAERLGLYLPRVSSYCGGCGVREHCPVRS
jgi:hypothetical protein